MGPFPSKVLTLKLFFERFLCNSKGSHFPNWNPFLNNSILNSSGQKPGDPNNRNPPRFFWIRDGRGIYFRIVFFLDFFGIFFRFWLLGFLASWLLGFLASWLLGFLASRLLGFLAFRLLGFLASRLLGFWASWLLGFGFLASWLLGFSASWLLGFWASRLFGFLLVYAAFGGFLAFRILCIPSSSSAGGVFPTSWGGLPPPQPPRYVLDFLQRFN